MMGKFATKDNGTNKQFNLTYIKVKEEDRVEIFMIKVIMIEEVIKIGTDQIVEMEEFSMDKIEVDLGMNRFIGMIIGEEILEVM